MLALLAGPALVPQPPLLASRPAVARTSSIVAGDKLERSLAGDQVSHVRTSTQYWCDDSDECTSHPTIRAVTERMMNVAKMPVDHAEYFQILRYEKGQFYRQHHDQNSGLFTPQGVRVYTFFMRAGVSRRGAPG